MPRLLPPLAKQFEEEVLRARDLVQRLENARIALARNTSSSRILHYSHIEMLHEFAYLRIFLAWEVFLEQTFFRYLCGYRNSIGQEIMRSGVYYRTLANAENAVLGGRDYVLWHNPVYCIRRVQGFLVNSRHETVLASNQTRVEHFAHIRHRIAHSQDHAKNQFDRATMTLCGRRYSASRPGKFLRDKVPRTSPPRRWLSEISDELVGLAWQIGP